MPLTCQVIDVDNKVKPATIRRKPVEGEHLASVIFDGDVEPHFVHVSRVHDVKES